MFSNEKQIRSISNQSKSNKLAKETVRGKRKDKLLLKQKWASHCTMSQKKKKSICTTIALPFQETLTTYFATEELQCYIILLTNQQCCGPQTRKPFKV
jgi:hypothetical protein